MTSATSVSGFSPQLLPDRAVIRLAGDGALAFLHNLLTKDLSKPQPAYGALLSPQGKILHDVFVVPDGDVIWIDVAAVQAADLLKRLMMYRLRAKLDISMAEDKAVGVGCDLTLPGLAYADPRLAALGARTIMDRAALPAGTGYLARCRQLGVADSTLDIGSGELFPHEANLDQLHGVSFHKGCYVGQEVVSRTHHRHTARNRILPVSVEGSAERGADILSGDTRVGSMLSSDAGHGLALIRLDRLAEATTPLLTGAVSLRVHKPAWAQFDVVIPDALQ